MIVDKRSSKLASLARSGGDSLKLPDNRMPCLQARDDKGSSFKDHFDVRNELTRVKVDKHGAGQTDWIDDISSCPVYHPTKEEFEDPLLYIRAIASEAVKFGICKIVSPLVASVPAGVVLSKERAGFKFTTRIQPMRLANWDKDDKITFPESGRNYSLPDYEKMANRAFSRKFSTAASLPTRFVETEFWKELVSGKTRSVEYGCDVEGSAFSASSMDPLGQSKWNLKGISQLPKSTLRLLEAVIPGVTEPMLYIGMLFSMFAWHTEDHYLYSINYHHCGAPKTWYGVPGHAASDFEKVVQEHVYDPELLKDAGKGAVYDLLLGKTTMFAPKLLSEHDVPVFRAVQHPGEFVITFPRAYHAGFSHGFNCGEAVNFAMPDWFPFGVAACWRYGFLNRFPLLPHEEILCKEAMLISKMGTKSQEDTGCLDANHQNCVKAAFLNLIQFHQQVCLFLKQQGAQVKKSLVNMMFCGICKHTCYVSYIRCQCFPEPICSNHGREIRSCICGSDRCMFVRDDFTDLEATARKFECEDGVLAEALKGPSVIDSPIMDALLVEENMLNYKAYIPFGDVNAGKNKEREPSGGRHSSSNALVGSVGKNADAMAPLGGPASTVVKESFFLGRSSSLKDTITDIEQSTSISGKRPKVYEGGASVQLEISCTVSASDGKQFQEEEESDTEAFRVKRRRLLPNRNRSFQVDSPGMKHDKSVVMTSKCDKKIAANQERVNKCGTEKESSSVEEEGQIVIHDIIRELDLKGSVAEVIQRWQVQAGNRDMSLKTHHVVIEGKKSEVLSLKGCHCLKKLLSEQKALKLERLMQRFSSKNRSGQVDTKDSDSSHHSGCSTQGSVLKPVGLSSRPKSLVSVTKGEEILATEFEKNEAVLISKGCVVDEARKDTGLTEKRQKLQFGLSKIKASGTCDEVKRVNISSRVGRTIPHNEFDNMKQMKLMVHGGSADAEADFSSKSAYELAHGMLSGGDPVKYSGNLDKNHEQKVNRLKVKGPHPPDLIGGNSVKEAKPLLDFEGEMKGELVLVGSVDDKEFSSDTYQPQLISKSAFRFKGKDKVKETKSLLDFEGEKKGELFLVGSVADKGLSSDTCQPQLISKSAFRLKGKDKVKLRHLNDDNVKQDEINLKNGCYVLRSADDINPLKAGRKLRTETHSKSKKELIIHLKRKVDHTNKSLVAAALETVRQKEDVSSISGKCLDQGESLKPRVESTLCANQEGASSCAGYGEGQCSSHADSSGVADFSSCQGSVSVHSWQSGSKDGPNCKMKCWEEIDRPSRNSLENNEEYGESAVKVQLADSNVSVKNYHKDVTQGFTESGPLHNAASLPGEVCHEAMKSSTQGELDIDEKYSQGTVETKESTHPGCFVALSNDAPDLGDSSKDLGCITLLKKENGLQQSSNIGDDIFFDLDTPTMCSPLVEVENHIKPGEWFACESVTSKQPAVGISSGMFSTGAVCGHLQSKDVVGSHSKDNSCPGYFEVDDSKRSQ